MIDFPRATYCRWFASTYYLSGFSGSVLTVSFLVLLGKHFTGHFLGVSCSKFPLLSQRRLRELHLGKRRASCTDLLELFLDSSSYLCMGPSRVGISPDPLRRHTVDAGFLHLPVLRNMVELGDGAASNAAVPSLWIRIY